MIRFISFDLWLTLIKSNPDFKKKRAELIADKFNPGGLTLSSVFDIIQNIDRACDKMNERTGEKVATEFMYHKILERLGFNSDKSQDLLLEIKLNVNKLFLEYKPLMLNDNIYTMLIQLKREGYLLNISSNTGFIEGACLMKLFEVIDIDSFFDFAVFSDEINASKPSPVFYEYVFNNINGKKNEVIHIGDNYLADYRGAMEFGFNALLIRDKEYSVELIENALNEKSRVF